MEAHQRLRRLKCAFYFQRFDAGRRGLGFEFTFDEWLAFWKASGKLHLRGHGRGKYVMARNGDRGPYAPGNVRIIRFEANASERRCNPATREKMRLAALRREKAKRSVK